MSGTVAAACEQQAAVAAFGRRAVGLADDDVLYREAVEAVGRGLPADLVETLELVPGKGLPDLLRAAIARLRAEGDMAFVESVANTLGLAIRANGAQRELRETEVKLRALTDSNMLGILVADLGGKVLDANDTLLRMLGHTREDLVAGRVAWEQMTPVEHRAADERAIADLGRVGVVKPYEKEFVRADGSRVPVLACAAMLSGSERKCIAFVLDLTSQKLLEVTAKTSEAQFHLLTTDISDYAIFMLDSLGRVASWNAGAERLKGYKADEAIGRPFSCFYQKADVENGKADRDLALAVETGRSEAEGWRVRKDGSRFWANVILTALRDESGRLRGFSKVTRDMTAAKRASDQKSALVTRLERSNRELQDFAAVASHDLQEPLRKVQAFGDRLKEILAEKLDPEGRDCLDRMQKAASRMQNLINDLLAFARVTSHAKPFLPVDLGKIAREVVADLETRMKESGGRVEIDSLPEIAADPTQMRQLLQNLVANALKFRRKDAPSLVRVRAESDPGGTVRLIVEDNGIGFDEKYLSRLFTIFQRLHGRNEYEGTGVGLAICRKIAERHGGSITARSKPDAGATFVVTFPPTRPGGDT